VSKNLFVFKASDGLVRAMSANLYREPSLMIAELVINGLDAATRRGVVPEIAVRFWTAGEHPMSPDSPAMTVLDNGTGFTDEVIADYVRVGESAHRNDARFHGTHGLGKLAAFGLGHDRFAIVTRPQGSKQVLVYWIAAADVFSGHEIKAERAKGVLPGLPGSGPFTFIVIPDFNGSVDEAELHERLTQILPIRPCQVTVQDQLVELRRFQAEREVETPPLPAFSGGTIRFRLAVAEVTGRHDRVRIIDVVSGRPVTSFETLPASIRRRLEPILLHPKLQGEVLVPGNLEKHSETGRSGIAAAYWSSEHGEVLIAALNVYGAPLASELLGSETKPKGPIEDRLGDVADLFTKSFGEPDDSVEPEPDDKGTKPTDKPGTKPQPDGKGGGLTKKGDGKKNERTGRRNSPPSFGGVLVKVEDTTYTVISFACDSDSPCHVRLGNTIVINTRHREVERVQKMAPSRVREELARHIIEAHVAAKHGDGSDLFGQVYKILAKLKL
jgi:hypothetical protein